MVRGRLQGQLLLEIPVLRGQLQLRVLLRMLSAAGDWRVEAGGRGAVQGAGGQVCRWRAGLLGWLLGRGHGRVERSEGGSGGNCLAPCVQHQAHEGGGQGGGRRCTSGRGLGRRAGQGGL